MTKFLLDSGNPQEYKEIQALAKEQGSELWGSTTNPSLIAKSASQQIAASGKKLSIQGAFSLQKQLVLEIVAIVPGAVSAEVFADKTTTAEEMAEQGRDIASWHQRVVVKLPTTLEGMKARTMLRKEGIGINNTLVFSQQQVYAITLHEKLMVDLYGPAHTGFPAFISPFIGRLDDHGENGLSLLKNSLQLVRENFNPDLVWMLSASIRSNYHVQETLSYQSELITAPAKVYQEWFETSHGESLPNPQPKLLDIALWTPNEDVKQIHTIDALMEALESKKLDISHPLTTTGIDKFVADWNTILSTQ